MPARILRLAGLLLFAAAFALPAIRLPQKPPPGPISEPGWICAAFATAATGRIGHLADATPAGSGPAGGFDLGAAVALILSGWVNPLFLLYLVLCFWPRTVVVRRVLAALILLGFVASWYFFLKVGFIPLIGHVLWVAGPLIAFLPELLERLREPKPKASVG